MSREAVKLLREYFGLNMYEARAYLAILKGASTHKEISRASGVPLPRVYDTVENLERMGLVRISDSGVEAVEPSAAIRAMMIELERRFMQEQEERRRAGDRLVGILSKLARERSEGSEILILRGLNSIASKMLEICNSHDELVFTVRKGIRVKERLKPYLEALATSGKRRIRFILHSRISLSEEDLQFFRKINAEITFSENIMLDVLVTDGEEAIIGLPAGGEDAIAIWVKHESFTSSLMEAVNELWEYAKRIKN
ncbi:MAG: hypothetical protein NXY59_08245 [Aigarchaeota archaeon]|nr:hypothetical protein [Candidatus Pelearchaeum maunauluense]